LKTGKRRIRQKVSILCRRLSANMCRETGLSGRPVTSRWLVMTQDSILALALSGGVPHCHISKPCYEHQLTYRRKRYSHNDTTMVQQSSTLRHDHRPHEIEPHTKRRALFYCHASSPSMTERVLTCFTISMKRSKPSSVIMSVSQRSAGAVLVTISG